MSAVKCKNHKNTGYLYHQTSTHGLTPLTHWKFEVKFILLFLGKVIQNEKKVLLHHTQNPTHYQEQLNCHLIYQSQTIP